MNLSKDEIKAIIPHREPFLLIDEMVDLEPGVKGTGILHLTGNEFFFAGHFPENPIMPGVLMLEALAQAGACVILSHPDFKGLLGLLGSIKNAKFRNKAVPGDTLCLEVEVQRSSRIGGNARLHATVNGKTLCTADIMTAFVAV